MAKSLVKKDGDNIEEKTYWLVSEWRKYVKGKFDYTYPISSNATVWKSLRSSTTHLTYHLLYWYALNLTGLKHECAVVAFYLTLFG